MVGILPDAFHLLFASWLSLANKEMSRLLLASLDLHELVKLQHPPLAARPPFATLMEDWLARVMHTFFLISWH